MRRLLNLYDIVASKMGHDEGRLYVVSEILNEDFVYLIDGDKRKLDNPKKKRQKHLRFLANLALEQGFKDENIRAILKEWRNNAQRG